MKQKILNYCRKLSIEVKTAQDQGIILFTPKDIANRVEQYIRRQGIYDYKASRWDWNYTTWIYHVSIDNLSR